MKPALAKSRYRSIRLGGEIERHGEFWRKYYLLPESVREQSRQAYRLFMTDPNHPSLRFKKLNGPGEFWSVRFGGGYRAVCRRDGENATWLWVGTRQDFGKMF